MEQPVEFTMGSLLDPTMAQLLIGAYKNYADFAYRDYKDYMDQQKEFNKEMGDFFSYFQKDNQDWYNATRGKLQKTYDALVAQGIDPIRSIEGRAAMTQARMSIDSGELSNLRANAKASEDYMKTYLALRSQGKMNDDMNDFFLREQGQPSFRDFNTRQNGLWKAAPTEYKSLYDVTKDAFEGIKDSQISSKNGVQTVGVSEERMQAIADGLVAAGFGDSGYGKYYREKTKQRLEAQFGAENVTPEMVDKEFANDIKKQHQKEIRTKENLDPVWAKKADLAQHAADRAQNERHFRQSRADARKASRGGRHGGGGGGGQSIQRSPLAHMLGQSALQAFNAISRTSDGKKAARIPWSYENGLGAIGVLRNTFQGLRQTYGITTVKGRQKVTSALSTTGNVGTILAYTGGLISNGDGTYTVTDGSRLAYDTDVLNTIYSPNHQKYAKGDHGRYKKWYHDNHRLVWKPYSKNNFMPYMDNTDNIGVAVRGEWVVQTKDARGNWKRDNGAQLTGKQVNIMSDAYTGERSAVRYETIDNKLKTETGIK